MSSISQSTNRQSTNSTDTNSTASEAQAIQNPIQDPSQTNPAWTKEGEFEFHKLHDCARRIIIGYVGATKEGAKSLALLNRGVQYRSMRGITAEMQANIPALSTLNLTPEEVASARDNYRSVVKNLEKPNEAYRLEIARSFIAKMEMYLQDVFIITPAEFHDIMGREFILKREKNKPANEQTPSEDNLAFNLDYARHIALAFNLAKFTPDNPQQNIAALLKVDLTKIDQAELKRHFDNQKRAVKTIRKSSRTEENGCLLSNAQLAALPPEIGILTKVTELHLAQNELSCLPPEIGNLKALIWLGCPMNKLSSLPDEIGQLKNLTNLYVYSNQLTRLPQNMMNLASLTRFDLCENPFIPDDNLNTLLSYFVNKQPKCHVIMAATSSSCFTS